MEQMTRHGVADADLLPGADSPRAAAMLAAYSGAARAMMMLGAPLANRIPGRAGWELRLVVQGGLRILEKMQSMNYATWCQRPHLGKPDFALLAWRALRGSTGRQLKVSA